MVAEVFPMLVVQASLDLTKIPSQVPKVMVRLVDSPIHIRFTLSNTGLFSHLSHNANGVSYEGSVTHADMSLCCGF